MTTPADIGHMHHALALGRRGLGRTLGNPSVGCVIVSSEGIVVGRGRTADGGIPHGEAVALAQAGHAARGATAYVTLEPCAAVTRTLSCAESLIAAGIRRVVAAMEDPHPLTAGKGFAKLRAAGIEVATGVLADEAARSHAGFLMRLAQDRPLVTLKIAQSLDGKTATVSGDSKWLTGAEARRFGHLLRAQNDAILVGINTALADDPELTCRIAGLQTHSPLRVVLDTRLRLHEGSKLAATAAQTPTLVFTAAAGGGAGLAAAGVEVIRVARDARGRPDLAAMLGELAKRGVTRLLVEGGATVHAAFLDRGVADALEIFTAPMTLGGAGHSAIDALAALSLEEAPKFTRTSRREFGADVLESYVRRA
ncbi:MAG TPA: bifunctional diaminohydroxyphosphoribosylaminopyrimidine deaminase/5-amino-6-(5-phosphoribosylamino)uracil reductase RibD [Rhizomicrobium sp.]|jgi:diaminohydroxyphosphoribosylaminopyrimidine deaminase/5-amino-6-(5-phosphoribosylamino)uracil reductase|nr:bifunctional diaminohydroxyphosphoribosylaminopyrimidine deaminase/5-amino-6-(5-phosphoribosylamino)uracil reductase RibD [Rhizomicrobium sp.]